MSATRASCGQPAGLPWSGERAGPAGPAARRLRDVVPRAAAYVAGFLITVGSFGPALADQRVLFAEPAHLASRSLLLDIAAAGERLVAVGDRGHVLLSDDNGMSWVQADSVPTQALLTAVCFIDARRGIAVGHDEVILTTQDAGRTWNRTHYAPEAQQPLLDVWCGADGGAIAVGAYSAYLTSQDAGASWSERKFEARPPHVKSKLASALPRSGAPLDAIGRDYHLNRIVATASATRFYIAAEAGHVYRCDDGGSDWIELPSPYGGSFFGVLPLEGDSVLAYGLRGNLFRSEDAGSTWRRIATGTVAMLDDAVKLGNGGVAVVGLSGVVLVSRDGGQSFTLLQQDDRKGLSAAVALDANTVAVVGEGGVKRAQLGRSVVTGTAASIPSGLGATRESR